MRAFNDGLRLKSIAIACIASLAILLLPANGSEPALAQADATVSIADFSFSPASLTIEAGTTVTWVNNGAAPHTATGDGGSFDTGQIAAGGSAGITFDTPGTYTYICSIHPQMTGTIVVTAAGDDGDDDGGTDGDDDGGTQLPDTGVGSSLGGNDASSMGLIRILIAGALFTAGFSLRRRSSAQ